MDIFSSLKEKLDYVNYVPVQRTDILAKEEVEYCILKNPSNLEYLNLSPDEYYIWTIMDGKSTIKDLILEYFYKFNAIAPNKVFALVSLLKERGFLADDFPNLYSSLRRKLSVSAKQSWLDRIWDILRGARGFEWKGADATIDWLYRVAGWILYKTPLQFIFVSISLVGAVLFSSQLISGEFDIFKQGGSYLLGMVTLFALSYLMIIFHELSHALTCKHYGCRVNGCGVIFYFGMLCLYVNTKDIWMADRRGRIATSFAGPYSGLVLAGVCSFFVAAFPENWASSILFKCAFILYLDILFNLFPFLELDGYYMLMDWLSIPMLRGKSFDFIRHGMWKKVRKREGFSKRDWLFTLFGISSLLFSVGIAGLSILFWKGRLQRIVAELWPGGWLSKVALIGFGGALLLPILNGLGATLLSQGSEGRKRFISWWENVNPSHKSNVALLRSTHFLSSVEYAKLQEIARIFRRETFGPGAVVFDEGDVGDRFYLIRDGKAEVFRASGGQESKLALLSTGDYFGELALIEKAPRAASVRAVTRLDVLTLKKGDFDRHLAAIVPKTATVDRIKSAEDVRSFPLFSGLGSSELNNLLVHLEREWFPAATEIIREGDQGDKFFLIHSGKVEVIIGGERIKFLQKADYFGEMALVNRAPRAASVLSVTPVELFSLKGEHFNQFLTKVFSSR